MRLKSRARSTRSTTNGRGFTLVEVLIALAVLSVGLLGSAALLLDSLRIQSASLRRVAAANLLRTTADRLRADTLVCVAPACDVAQVIAGARVGLAEGARAVLPGESRAGIDFAPAIGPAALDHFVISLRWRDPRADEDDIVSLQMLAAPVAG
jgi:prepilin-type N-terminal cleavage/methylation domain-containing protein